MIQQIMFIMYKASIKDHLKKLIILHNNQILRIIRIILTLKHKMIQKKNF